MIFKVLILFAVTFVLCHARPQEEPPQEKPSQEEPSQDELEAFGKALTDLLDTLTKTLDYLISPLYLLMSTVDIESENATEAGDPMYPVQIEKPVELTKDIQYNEIDTDDSNLVSPLDMGQRIPPSADLANSS